MNEPWTRAAAGLDTVYLGDALPRLHTELTPLRVHCAPPSGPLGPLRTAHDRARRALGLPPSAWSLPAPSWPPSVKPSAGIAPRSSALSSP